MAKLLEEHTYGDYIYMKMEIDGKVEEIGVFIRETGWSYRTTSDSDPARREEVIDAFHELY